MCFGLGQEILTSVDVSKPLNHRNSRIIIAFYGGGEKETWYSKRKMNGKKAKTKNGKRKNGKCSRGLTSLNFIF